MSSSAESDPSRSGGINPFSGPEPAPARASATPAVGRRPVPAPPPGRSAAPPGATPARRTVPSSRSGTPRRTSGGANSTHNPTSARATAAGPVQPRDSASRGSTPARPTGPTDMAAPTDLLPHGGAAFPPGGPHGWAGGPGRRAPSGLLAANQRVTEPPAGLGPGGRRGPAPILPPLAGAGDPGDPWSAHAWQGHARRPWIVAGLVLVVVAALGVTGAVLLAHRIGGTREESLLVQARELSYRVPADWRTSPGGPETSAAGVALDGVATGERYTCGARGRYRATVGSTFLVRRDGVDARPEDATRDFGPMFATSFYGAGATANASAPAPLTVGALTGSTSLVTVHPAAGAGCAGLVGRLTVLALPTTRRGAAGGTGVLLLVVQHDASGGPSSPEPVDESVVSGILSSVRVADVPADAPITPAGPAGDPADTTSGPADPTDTTSGPAAAGSIIGQSPGR